MMGERFNSVWDALEDTPEQAENMKLRAVLLTALKDYLNRHQFTQTEAAKLLGVTQPRVSDLMRGRIHLFGLDSLVNMTVAAGLTVELKILEKTV
jgi:predicted XRE-type DNA-binding protein